MAVGAVAILDPELEEWQQGQKLIIIPDGVKPLPPRRTVRLQYDFHVSAEDKKLSGPEFHRRFMDPAGVFFALQRTRLESVTEPEVVMATSMPNSSADRKMIIDTGFDVTMGGDYGTISQLVRVRQRGPEFITSAWRPTKGSWWKP